MTAAGASLAGVECREDGCDEVRRHGQEENAGVAQCERQRAEQENAEGISDEPAGPGLAFCYRFPSGIDAEDFVAFLLILDSRVQREQLDSDEDDTADPHDFEAPEVDDVPPFVEEQHEGEVMADVPGVHEKPPGVLLLRHVQIHNREVLQETDTPDKHTGDTDCFGVRLAGVYDIFYGIHMCPPFLKYFSHNKWFLAKPFPYMYYNTRTEIRFNSQIAQNLCYTFGRNDRKAVRYG